MCLIMRNLILLFPVLISLATWCQELSYKQFTVKDGLPGSVVYQTLQDRSGFIWFATNQGVSRFDGRTFTNYFKEDGLPDNEIIKLYLDKFNNIWFISFTGIPAVFHKGAIIRFDSCRNVKAICEDPLTDSVVMISDSFNGNKTCWGYYQSLNISGKWQFTPCFTENDPAGLFNKSFLRSSSPEKIGFYFSVGSEKNYKLTIKSNTSLKQHFFKRNNPREMIHVSDRASFCVTPDKKAIAFFTIDSVYYADFQQIRPVFSCKAFKSSFGIFSNINAIFYENDSTIWLCTRDLGLICIKNFLTPNVKVHSFFDKSFCTSIIKDQENGYWITTYGDGVFYLPNLCFYSLSTYPGLIGKNALCIKALDKHHIAAGFADGNILKINHINAKNKRFREWATRNKNNRVLDIWPLHRNSLLIGTDRGLQILSSQGIIKLNVGPIKQIHVSADSTILIASASSVQLIKKPGHPAKSLFHWRATCLTGRNNQYYWGTLHGAFSYSNGLTTDLGQHYPALSGVINHLDIGADAELWASTQQGMVILKDGMIITIKKEQGILSNTCKHVSFDKNTAWVSTDKGVSRIDYRWSDNRLLYSISNITEEDGLTANDVNQTLPAGNNIWAATARGISYFSKSYISHSYLHPQININKIIAGNETLPVTDTVMVNYQKSKLLIELSGISYRSGKQIHYEYRLKELDSTWSRINSNIIEFPALPFGRFVFEVRAVDRWGTKSDQPKRMLLINNPPFWRTTWFTLLTYFIIVVFVGSGFFIFYRWQQRKRERDYHLKRKMHELEMMALRAQMNPHFIFNCLTSIQYHIIRADVRNANNYLHKFSTLIRQTLQHSTASTIPLREEIRILELYLELEKLRLGERMDYQVQIPDDLKQGNLSIPSMIIQPFVENAIKHGIAPLEDRKGILLIEIKRSGGYIECIIEDNGPGIHTMQKEKPAKPGDYRSMGAGITTSRIQTINATQKQKILLRVTDKQEGTFPGSGTIVHLSFPIITT